MMAIPLGGRFRFPGRRRTVRHTGVSAGEHLARVRLDRAWWVGLGFVCALVGNVWPALNPWAAVPALLPEGLRRRTVRPMPSWIGVWPAVFLYLCFAWAELVWPNNTAPASLASAILIYSAVTWAGMARYGIEPWLRCGETFSIVFGLFGRFAPLARTAQGRLVLRHYGSGLAGGEKVPVSMVVLAVTLLATVSFDGFLHTPVWARFYAAASHGLYDLGWTQLLGNTGARTLIFTTGLVLAPLCFVALFLGTCAIMARLASRGEGAQRGAMDVASSYVLTLVPIAICLSPGALPAAVDDRGTTLYGHISDPFGVGWDLFGTAGVTPTPPWSTPASCGCSHSSSSSPATSSPCGSPIWRHTGPPDTAAERWLRHNSPCCS